jgi:hypothetical protein
MSDKLQFVDDKLQFVADFQSLKRLWFVGSDTSGQNSDKLK